MSKKIIISGRERILKPYIAFIFSFFITGAGEIYSGSPQRGIILALMRAAAPLALPFYAVTNIKSSYLTEIFLSLLFFLSVSLFSPFNALIITLKKKRIVVSKFSSVKFAAVFAGCNLIITLLALSLFFSFFSIRLIHKNYPPVIEQGDVAVINKFIGYPLRKGETILLKNDGNGILRLIGLQGEKVIYSKGRFSVQGSEIPQSVFTESELKKFSVADFDVISETEGSFKYPVIQNRDQYAQNITLKDDEYFAAPDDRNEISGFIKIKKENIYGRVEGVLFSIKRLKFLIKPFIISE